MIGVRWPDQNPAMSVGSHRRIAWVTIAVVCLASAIVASAPGASQRRQITLGVEGSPGRFHTLTRQASSTRLVIIGWNQGASPPYFARLFSTMLAEPMLGIGIPTGTRLSPADIANGKGDAFLLAINQAVVAWGKPIYLRPLAEMNGAWNAYCAYNRNGSSRGPRYSTREFRKAFARIYLIVHGDPEASTKLAKLGLPPVAGELTPAPNVQVIWNPQGFGDPDVRGNSAQAYYPGNQYVDVVGDDLYDIRYKAEWPAAAALYKAHPGKPFAFPEWGLWGIDDPSFVRTMAQFVRTHGRTVLISYFNSKPGSIWDIASKSQSRSAYRRLIPPLGR
jgi:hypothetical protein